MHDIIRALLTPLFADKTYNQLAANNRITAVLQSIQSSTQSLKQSVSKTISQPGNRAVNHEQNESKSNKFCQNKQKPKSNKNKQQKKKKKKKETKKKRNTLDYRLEYFLYLDILSLKMKRKRSPTTNSKRNKTKNNNKQNPNKSASNWNLTFFQQYMVTSGREKQTTTKQSKKTTQLDLTVGCQNASVGLKSGYSNNNANNVSFDLFFSLHTMEKSHT